MKIIRNLEKKQIIVSVNGKDWILPGRKTVFVDNDVWEDLKNRLPLSFDFKPEKKGDVIPKAQFKKTKAYLKAEPATTSGEDMIINKTILNDQTAPDQTPLSGTIDNDGVAWYGKGVVEEKI